MRKIHQAPALLAAILFLGPAAGQAEELQSGADARALALTCAGCHGTDGASAGPAAPSIGGMHPDYFFDIMQWFAEEEVYSTVMGRIARGYTEEELEKMAAYFHELPFVPAEQEFDPQLAEEGERLHEKYCSKCHAEGGTVLEDEEYYVTAGQWIPYLKNAMADFRQDRRPIERKMEKKLNRMLDREGEASLDALFSFYASQQ